MSLEGLPSPSQLGLLRCPQIDSVGGLFRGTLPGRRPGIYRSALDGRLAPDLTMQAALG